MLKFWIITLAIELLVAWWLLSKTSQQNVADDYGASIVFIAWVIFALVFDGIAALWQLLMIVAEHFRL